MTKPSSPTCYACPLPVDVSKLTNRQEFEDGLEVLPGDVRSRSVQAGSTARINGRDQQQVPEAPFPAMPLKP